MTRLRLAPAALAAALLAGCGSDRGSPAPWLTMGGFGDHARWFPVAGGSHDGFGFTCSDCHDPAASSFRTFTCTGCHTGAHAQAATDAKHAGVSGYVYADASCYHCHPQGIGVNHAPIFPIAAGSAHAGVACSSCHVQPGDRTVLGCAGCHPQHDQAPMATAHAAVVDYAFTSSTCVRCHPDSTVERMASHPFPITAGNHTGARSACLGCHTATRTDKPFGADFTTFTCYAAGCHDVATIQARHTQVPGWTSTSAACYRCHPNGVGGN